jgi:hypothetical protein
MICLQFHQERHSEWWASAKGFLSHCVAEGIHITDIAFLGCDAKVRCHLVHDGVLQDGMDTDAMFFCELTNDSDNSQRVLEGDANIIWRRIVGIQVELIVNGKGVDHGLVVGDSHNVSDNGVGGGEATSSWASVRACSHVG